MMSYRSIINRKNRLVNSKSRFHSFSDNKLFNDFLSRCQMIVTGVGKYDFFVNCQVLENLEVDMQDMHSYSDFEAFERLLKTILFITHHPCLFDPEKGSLKTLVDAMIQAGEFPYDYSASIRKDIEKVLKPYGLMPSHPMKKGYYLGTAILSRSELLQVFQLLQAQATSLTDPASLSVYETFKQRLEYSKITTSDIYPVRAIANRTIVDHDLLPSSSIAHTPQLIEEAILAGQLLEFRHLQGAARYPNQAELGFFKAWPLQLVFHNIAWYLGYELAEGASQGLLCFERLDRLFLGQKQTQARDMKTQQISLAKLQKLYQASSSIYLGRDAQLQRQYLSAKSGQRRHLEITLELWFSDYIFQFVSEGTNRFPKNKMQMSPKLNGITPNKKEPMFNLPKTGDPCFPNRFRVQLPCWSVDDIDLQRWILGYGQDVKVVQPPQLVAKFTEISRAMGSIYA